MKELGVLLAVVIVGALSWSYVISPGWDKYVKKYDRPWWKGTATQRVCPTFDDSEKCYYLDVESDGINVTRVTFNNGGYLYGESECHKAAQDYYDFDRFCRFWDQENRLWDINPISN